MKGVLLDSVILLHAAWASFLAVGFVFALRYSEVFFTIRIGEMVFVCLNVLGYIYLAGRRGWFQRSVSRT